MQPHFLLTFLNKGTVKVKVKVKVKGVGYETLYPGQPVITVRGRYVGPDDWM